MTREVSYWVSLSYPDGVLASVPPFSEGGTYALGGNDEATLNVTYNYSEVFKLLDFRLKDLHEKQAADTVDILSGLVAKLGTHVYTDYWAPTPGNAGHALNVLLGWAVQHPQAVWMVE